MNAFLGIGAAAGLVSGLLFSVPVTGTPLAFVLYLVAPLPRRPKSGSTCSLSTQSPCLRPPR